MSRQLRFHRLSTSFPGLMSRALNEWDRYTDIEREHVHWVCIEKPESMARALEILSPDLPEEELAMLVTRMPYLILLFLDATVPRRVPVEAVIAFLSVLNHASLSTILRQTADTHRLAELVQLDPNQFKPLLFILAGVPDIDFPQAGETAQNCSFM